MQVLDDGVSITLTGKDSDPLFLWASGMLVFALIVAVICFTMPVPYAIGSVAIWAVLMYFFNQRKHATKTQKRYARGVLIAKNRHLTINGMGMLLSDDVRIDVNGDSLVVFDRGVTHRFLGFEDEREIAIAKAVLMGQKVARRNANITLNEGGE